jgi:hypothetical protein
VNGDDMVISVSRPDPQVFVSDDLLVRGVRGCSVAVVRLPLSLSDADARERAAPLLEAEFAAGRTARLPKGGAK